MTEKKFKVNMHCATCANAIEKALKKEGIKCEPNAPLKLVKVKYDEEKVTSEDIIRIIKETGYEATEK